MDLSDPVMDLSDLRFQNSFAAALPGDAVETNVPRPVRNASYTKVSPTPVRAPQLLAWSDALGEELGIARPAPGSPALEALAGNRVLPGMQPYAAPYGGHPFAVGGGRLAHGPRRAPPRVVRRSGGPQ